jgi:ribosomal protein S18 acetylase RimI-like enzyme
MAAKDSQIAVRQAGIDDLDRIVLLFDAYRQFYRQPSDTDLARSFLRQRFQRNESIVFVALEPAGETDRSALGFTQLYPSFSSALARPIFVLNDLFVVPEARRRSVGSRLLRIAAEFGRQAGAARLQLSTELDNASAQALYESSGWQRDKTFCSYTLPLDK